jgi:hypothetical protein
MNKRILGLLLPIVALNALLMIATLTYADPEPLALPSADAGGPVVLPGYELIDGDIIVPVGAATRSTFEGTKWPQGIVYYAFASDVSSTNRDHVRAAMREWEQVAGVVFVPRTTQNNYIRFINSSGNWSYIGMIGGEQYIGIYNWNARFVIAHEIAHALGFWHEQSRPDRDTYVEIRWENIIPGTENNFAIRASAQTDTPYDFESIMHYFREAFSKNGLPTIVAKSPYTAYNTNGLMGQQSRLSDGDKAGMLARYPGIVGDYPTRAFTIPDGATSYTDSRGTSGYTRLSIEPAAGCAPDIGRTLWYLYTPTYDNVVTVSAGGYDTAVAVYTGNTNNWVAHGCANVISGSGTETLTFNAQAGMRYAIMVGGASGGGGTLSFNMSATRNLVVDGGFEGSGKWVRRSEPAGRADDKVLCGSGRRANGSRCAYLFIGGSGENSIIRQVITPANRPGWTFASGQVYDMSLSMSSNKPAANLSMSALVTYGDSSTQSTKLGPISGLVPAHQRFNTAFTLNRADVVSIRVVVRHRSTAGRVWVDDVRLVHVP